MSQMLLLMQQANFETENQKDGQCFPQIQHLIRVIHWLLEKKFFPCFLERSRGTLVLGLCLMKSHCNN